MRSLLLVPALWSAMLSLGDKSQRTYLDLGLQPTSRGKAMFYKEPAGQDPSGYVGRIYTMDGTLKAEGHYADAGLRIAHGHFTYFHKDGKVESEGDYAMGNKSGVWQRWSEWGEPLAEKVYNPEPLANIIYKQVTTMPEFPGGQQAMLTYLNKACGHASGATASFVVEKDGDLSEIKVLGALPAISDQLVQALEKAPRFEVGEKEGVPVRVQMRVPLK